MVVRTAIRHRTRKVTATEKELLAQMDEERLFGADVNFYEARESARILARVCRSAKCVDVSDDDIWESIANFIKTSERQELLDTLIPSRTKQAEFLEENSGYRRRSDFSSQLESLYRELPSRRTIWNMLGGWLDARVEEYSQRMASLDYKPHSLQGRIAELQQCLGLNDQERDILLVLFLQEKRLKLGDFAVGSYRHGFDTYKLAMLAGMDEASAANYLAENANLRKFGIIDEDGDLYRSYINFLVGTSNKALSERFWTKCTEEALPWEFHGKIAEEHGKTICDMITGKPAENGISILLYGAAGAGKTSFAISLAATLGKDLYFIAQNDKDSSRQSYSASFRYAALAAAQRQLDPAKSILVVDECDDMIEACQANGFFFGLFSAREDGAETKGQLNTVIDENRHTVIWICNSQQNTIALSSRRRFDYSVLFDELLPETRMHIWDNCLKQYGCVGRLSEDYIAEVSRRYKVNAGGIALAVKNAAALVASDPSKSFDDCVTKFLKAHCTLLGIRRSNDERLEPARDYSLEGLNIKSGIRPERIIEVCRNFLAAQGNPTLSGRDRPRMNLLLHGVPGSGKTEFVKYLAKCVDRKLNIKNASDLLSMYVGGTEHLLAAAFAEAEKNNEILFIDEGDSMLAPRGEARRSWEVSQVNTLLTEMENFNGIFVVSTNLIQKLDPAALRRFTFRIHFDYLDNTGKEVFFRTYFGGKDLPEFTDDERAALHAIDRLTPSDYRNVRQQLFYLNNVCLTNAEIIEALKAEAQSRDSQGEYKGLGEERHGIGFGE